MNGEHWAFRKNGEMLIGYDSRDFDDEVRIRIQSGHLEIDPDQIFLVLDVVWLHRRIVTGQSTRTVRAHG
jgi:hypothetical protein